MALSDLISSITGEPAKAPLTSSAAPKSSAGASRPINSANGTRPQLSSTGSALKRKAGDDQPAPAAKLARVAPNQSTSATPSRSATSSPAVKQSLRLPPTSTSQSSGRPQPPKGSAPGSGSKNATSTQASAAPKPAAPASGYLAVLARAKQAQQEAKPLGQIKHSKTTKLSRRERERQQAEAKVSAAAANKSLPGKAGKPVVHGQAGRPGSSAAVQKERKPVEVGYKGTMRPTAPPAYRGTMQSGGAASARRAASKPAKKSDNEYARWSDEDEMEMDDEEDERDYDSASSDMEAGMDDIDEEEMLSSMMGRKEDAEALREENELKRQKLERQRKLQQLQAAAAKKKKIY